MDAMLEQVLQFLNAAKANPPQPEYCLLWLDHWASCMPRSEWSGWVQAIGSVAAIIAGAVGIAWQVHRQRQFEVLQAIETAHELVSDLCEFMLFALNHIREWHAASQTIDCYRALLLTEQASKESASIAKVFELTNVGALPQASLKLAVIEASVAFAEVRDQCASARTSTLNHHGLAPRLADDQLEFQHLVTRFEDRFLIVKNQCDHLKHQIRSLNRPGRLRHP